MQVPWNPPNVSKVPWSVKPSPVRHSAIRGLVRCFQRGQPVFQGGALRSQLRLARANWQEPVLSYQQTVQNAPEQVSNSLVASQKDREFREQQEFLTQQRSRPINFPRFFTRTAARATYPGCTLVRQSQKMPRSGIRPRQKCRGTSELSRENLIPSAAFANG